MDMPTYFVVDNPAFILFEKWAPRRTNELIWSSVVVFFIAVFHEALRKIQDIVRRRETKILAVCIIDKSDKLGEQNGEARRAPCSHPEFSLWDLNAKSRIKVFFRWHHIALTFLHGSQMVLSYFMMLIAMTYNIYLFVAMVVGIIVAHFLWSWKTDPAALRSEKPNCNCMSIKNISPSWSHGI